MKPLFCGDVLWVLKIQRSSVCLLLKESAVQQGRQTPERSFMSQCALPECLLSSWSLSLTLLCSPHARQPQLWDRPSAASPRLLSACTLCLGPQTLARIGALKLYLVFPSLPHRSLDLASSQQKELLAPVLSVPLPQYDFLSTVALSKSDLAMAFTHWLWTTWPPSFGAVLGI